MAKLQPLKLSDLRSGVDYPVGTDVQERRCLFHVKLTDFSMRSIESLINSDKGAFFSLWFADGGGTISIPGSKEDRKFHFKTSQGDMDGLECVHQAVDSAKQPQLNCWGQVRYKLQVQGTKEVYERTKKLMKETEEQKQKTRTQTINFPHSSSKAGRTKSGGHLGRTGGGRPLVKTSSPFSTSSNPSTPHTSSSSSAAPSGGATGTNTSFGSKFSGTSSSSGTPPSISKNSGTRKSSKAPHTLRERIIHLLAVKPLKRTDIVNRLKKDTKRGETAMSKIDPLLQEVADNQGEMYILKQSLFCELRVDDWPFYSEAERQLVKRKHGSSDQSNESLKRSLPVRETPFPKRPKLSHVPPSTALPPPSQTQPPAQTSERHSSPPPSLKTSTNPPFTSNSQLNMPLFGMDSSNSANPSNIEMQSSSHLVRESSESTKHQELYPGTLVSSLILGSSSTASSVPVSVNPASSVSQQTSLEPSQTGLIVGRTGFGVAGSGGTEGSGDNRAPGVPGGGKLFGDLIAGNTASEPAQVESAQTKKEKKKKRNKTKEKIPEARSKSDSQSANLREGVIKTEGEKGEEVEMKSEEGSSAALKVKSEATAEENGASSTTPSTVDFSLLFPPITSDATRNEYKRIFNEEYQEYLGLKGQIEVITNEFTALSEQASVKKGTEEAKVLKRKIREMYTDLQQNRRYHAQKSRFQELHAKLGHIKKLVVEYDQTH